MQRVLFPFPFMSFVWEAASQRYLDLGELRAKEVGTRKWTVGARFPRLPIDAKEDREEKHEFSLYVAHPNSLEKKRK